MGSKQITTSTNGTNNGNGLTDTNGVQPVAKTKAENFQAEHEKFLDEFEKPTVIYRFIRASFLANPRFLYRNLSYMKERMPVRPKKSREKFDVNGLLKKAEEKQAEDTRLRSLLGKTIPNFLNIVVVGFFDGQTWAQNTDAKIEFQFIQILGSKRKDKFTFNKPYSGSCKLPLKSTSVELSPSKDFFFPLSKGKFPVMPVPKDAYNVVNGHVIQSIRVAIRVIIPASKLVSKSDYANGANENFDLEKGKQNGRTSYHQNNGTRKSNGTEEDSKNGGKRQRSLPNKDRENFVYEDSKRKPSNDSIVYIGILTLYDKSSNTNLPADGDVDLEIRLSLQDAKRSIAQKRVRRETSWEVSLPQDNAKVQDYLQRNGTTGCSAKLALAFRPSSEKMPAIVNSVEPVKPCTVVPKALDDLVKKDSEPVHVVYSFVMSNGHKQSTESRNDLRCPWCSINCLVLYSLLKHLEVCHPRFKFSFSPIPNGARVEVSSNESFDGSYTGSAFDLVAQPPGHAFGRDVAPGQRQQLFCMLAFWPKNFKRRPASLKDLFEKEESSSHNNRSYMIGHNRLYHHTTTCLPIHPREIDEDSEGEPDPEWLRVKTCMMIDEFTDVNEGEKEIMKMWNHHVMHENYVGDCQIPLACMKFVEKSGKKIIEKNLYRNFVLHLTNLFDFGLLPAPAFHATVQQLQVQMKETNSGHMLKNSWIKPSDSINGRNGNSSSVPKTSTSAFSVVSGVEKMEVDDDTVTSTASNGSDHKRNGL